VKTVTVHEAKTQLSRYLAEVEATGEEIVIARRDKPVARLVPIVKDHKKRASLIGALSGYLSEDAVEYLMDPALDAETEKDFHRSAEEA
jgi:prevent-host-death family protein